MNLKSYRKPGCSTQETAALADSVSDYVEQLRPNPMLVGRLIQGIAVSTTETIIDHKLGKTFLGWVVVRNNANVKIYESTQNNPTLTLSLLAEGPAVIDVWVF